MLPTVFLLPLLELLILVNAATFDIKNIKLYIIDNDKSVYSRDLIRHFSSNHYFIIAGYGATYKDGIEQLQRGNADVALCIPPHFERDVYKKSKTTLQLLVNAIDGATAGVINAYTTSIVRNFNLGIQAQFSVVPGLGQLPYINVTQSYWFNPDLDYRTYMAPGILVLLCTMVVLSLTSLNIVREKELGTIEQLNVSPIKRYQFIIGKIFPFWSLGLLNLALGIGICKLFYHVPIVGSLGAIFLFASLYMLTILGIGLLVSTKAETQQQAMFVNMFFNTLFMLTAGLFTPIESMPRWAQFFTIFNPIRYFVEVMRMVMLKGAGIAEIRYQLLIITAFAITMNGLALLSYRKTS
jgi:ABC-2 type transport system permease protein